MEIKIDEAMVTEAMEKATTDAVKSAFGDYEVKKAVQEAVSKAVLEGALVEAITNAMDKVDLIALSQALATEVARSTTRAVQHLIRESLVNMIMDMRGISSYASERPRVRAELMAEVFGHGCNRKQEPESET